MKKVITRFAQFLCIVSMLFLIDIVRVKAYSGGYETTFDTSRYIDVHSTQEVVSALLDARSKLQEIVVIRANPNQVKIESDRPGFSDLDSSIYNFFNYSYVGGVYNSWDYSVYSGPSCSGKIQDPMNPSYYYYKIDFEYCDNTAELALADSKLRGILSKVQSKSDVEKIIYLFNWMNQNVPEEKESDAGYERNCNGIYGCLFGDGTGYCCSTYASTIQRYCELAGINAYIVAGSDVADEMCHAFNIMQIGKKWYVTDYTTGDLLVGTNSLNKEYIKILKNHVPSLSFSKTDYEKTIKKVKVGDFVISHMNIYRITSKKTAELIGVPRSYMQVVIPDCITIKGKSYIVTRIDNEALFNDNALRKVTIGKSVTTIGENAFGNCYKLCNVIFEGDSVKTIHKTAFKGIKDSAKFTIKASSASKFGSVVKKLKKAVTAGNAIYKRKK
ncbi:leucine-rich repeat protein [Butyrivibrio sp. AE3004]|uniref:leucine-rich repeat protein n=1 Tax=Butyrivibrio sp. AE3004 TaxID=1506994 RepID=UPI0004946E1B|nr:leucine-rich repeat protein [Butyrivibrio sp. AE3004]